jgi:hypothetical protein
MAEENDSTQNDEIPPIQRWIAVLWPSFLVAGVQTVVFFTLFDPQYVFAEYDISRTGAYSVGFFLFWGFAILPGILTMYFAKPCKPCAVYKDEQELDKG